MPQANVRVVFVAPDGTSVVTATDAAGYATGPGIDDSAVFLAGVIGTTERLHVFTHVRGCTTIDLQPQPWDYKTNGAFLGPTSFQFEAPAVQQNAVFGPCGISAISTGTVVGQSVLQVVGCEEYEHDATLLALALDYTGISAWTTLEHVDLPAIVGQTVVVPPLDPPVPATVHWSNAPAGWQRGDTAFFAGPGLAWRGATQGEAADPVASDFDHVWRVAPLGPASFISGISQVGIDAEDHAVERVRPTEDLDERVDMADAIASITHVGVGPAISVHWTWGGNAAHHGDLAIARLHCTTMGGRDVRVYGPGDVDHLEVPPWPAALDDVRPDETHLRVFQVTAFDLDGAATYEDSLARGWLIGLYHGLDRGPEFPAVAYWRSTMYPHAGS